jgi:hypothetical protein
MENDFSFLECYYPLSSLASFAVEYLDSDPNSSVIKQGMILEYIIKVILKMNDLYRRSDKGEYPTLNDMITIAAQNELLPKNENVLKQMDSLRRERNFAVHEFLSSPKIAKRHLEFIKELCHWFINNWVKFKTLEYYADGGTGEFCFRLNDQYRLSQEFCVWDLDFNVPLQDGESMQSYTKRVLADLHWQ